MVSRNIPMYSRMKSCGVQKQGDSKKVISGVLEDELYAMQCELLVDWPSLTIESIQARLKRFTTERCILAEEIFQRAEGWKIDGQIEGRIKKELGRNGCRHMAALMIDCLRSLVRSQLVDDLRTALESDPMLDREAFVTGFFRERPELRSLAKLQSAEK